MNFKYKNILFFGIGFYDYDQSIIAELEKRGCHVDYINTVTERYFPRLLNRVGLKIIGSLLVSNEIIQKISKISGEVDCIFIIIGDNLDDNHFSLLKRKFPQTPIILYLWDDIERVTNYNVLAKYCNRVFTFDASDAQKYNHILRPLFFRETTSLDSSEHLNGNIKFDISFVGWHHTLRYPILSQLREELEEKGIRYKFLLLGRKWYFYIERYILRTIKKKDEDLFIFKSLGYSDYIEITKSSRVILDMPHPSQKGLTIRTIESLALGKKIYTTNQDITKYGFHSENYKVLEKDSPVDFEFILNETSIPEDMSRYSIRQFIEDLFEEK